MKITFTYILLLFVSFYTLKSNAQCTAGTVTTAHTSTVYDALLDPDGDGYITESGGAFTSDTTEMAEFEVLTNSINGWIEITDITEKDIDVNPSCGNTDLVGDKNGGDFAFYNIVDPTPLAPTSGDEYIVLRLRLPQDPNGNFGYNFLFDTDNNYGAATDPNAICGNQGFEREVQFANAGGKKGVSAYDVDGATTMSALSPPCAQCIALGDVQISCAAIAGDSIPGATPPDDDCNASDPSFVTFALELSYIGVSSDIAPEDFYVGVATASSGNATSVLGGGNVVDMGAVDGDAGGCPACVSLTGCALFDCQTDCVNDKFLADYTLPVELSSFEVRKAGDQVELNWSTAQEFENDHFVVQRSAGDSNFEEIGIVAGAGHSNFVQYYKFSDQPRSAGTFYYRLKQVDFDGKASHSEVKSVRFEANAAVTVFPTMVENQAVLQYQTDMNAEIKIKISDISGATAIDQTFAIQKGSNEFSLDLNRLARGMYFANIYNETLKQNHVVKLVKL